jgi:hypothetical protein
MKPSGVVRKLGRLLAPCAVAVWLLTTAATGHAVPSGFQEQMQDVPETGQAGLLSLTSSVLPLEIPWLEPGDSFSWQIGLRMSDQLVGDGALEFIPYDGLLNANGGYRLTVQHCETQWTGQSGTNAELTCASGARILLADSPLQLGPTPRIPIGEVATSKSAHILFTLSLPEEGAPREPFTFALGFTVLGDEAAGNYGLPDTGFSGVGVLTAAVVLLGVGLFATLAGRRAGK